MPRKKKPPEPAKTPFYVLDLDAEGEPVTRELGIVQEPEKNQTKFTLLSADLTRLLARLKERPHQAEDSEPPCPGA